MGAFHQAPIEVRQEMQEAAKLDDAKRYDAWYVAVWYNLCVLRLRMAFYSLYAQNPSYAELNLSALERCQTIAAAENLYKALSDL